MNKRNFRLLAILLAVLLLIVQPAQADPPHCGHLPVGTILAWYGDADDLPRGFVLFDGENGTLDLRGKFLMGADGEYPPGSTGGQNHTIHHHGPGTLATDSYKHRHYLESAGFLEDMGGGDFRNSLTNYDIHSHKIISGVTGNTEMDNRPEFVAVHFIMCVGK